MFQEKTEVAMSVKPKAYSASGAWICHAGRVRKVNEDASFFGGVFSGASMSSPLKARLDAGNWIIAVADGIGGHKAGAYASREVVVALSACTDITPDGVHKTLLQTNRKLHQAGVENPEITGSGTAVVGMLGVGDKLYAFNVGDAV